MQEYLHPSTRARLISENVTFVTSQGQTLLYSVFTSDKGPDNVITRMTSPSEYIFHYGAPNMEKHGQAGYNNVAWLESQGQVDCLRVMPEDAGYSHAIVNVQTKIGEKKVVKDINGNLVSMPNVEIRNVLHYTNINNISKESLINELKLRSIGKTIDGYSNNPLFVVFPKGRGKAYNNLGFSLKINTSYDTTYPFRMYDFYTTKLSETGAMENIEGPFNVALDPEAISNANESIHIKHVIEKNSQFFNIEFNNDVFYNIGETINPNVNPRSLDFFGGVDRLDENDQPMTYFDEVTQKDENIHISLQKYSEGAFTGLLNFVDGSDEIEGSIVAVDNGTRQSIQESRQYTVDNARYALSRFRKNAYRAMVEPVSTVVEGETGISLGECQLKEAYNDFVSSVATMSDAEAVYNLIDVADDSAKEAALNDLKLAADYSRIKANELIKVMLKSLDYSRAIRDTESSLNTLLSIYNITSSLNAYEAVSIKSISERGKVSKSLAELMIAKTDSQSVQISTAKSAMDIASLAIRTAESIEIRLGDDEDPVIAAKDQTQVDELLNTTKVQYNTALGLLDVAEDPYMLEEELVEAVDNLLSSVEVLMSYVEKSIMLAAVEVQLYTMKETKSSVDAAINSILVSVYDSLALVDNATTPELKKIIEDNMKAFIDISMNNASQSLLNSHTLVLSELSDTIPLMMGSDGSLDASNPVLKASTTRNLLIMGYKGLIDESILDKKIHPIDLILDANYELPVKEAMVYLVTKIRDDFMSINDTGFLANAKQAVDFRKNDFNVSSNMVAIFTQDGTRYDEYTGKNQRFTSTNLLASKIPASDVQYGLQRNFVGPKRGTVSGMDITWAPNETWMGELYKRKVNYIRSEPDRSYFDAQLTSQMFEDPYSLICNMRTALRIKREVEILAEDYKHEYNNVEVINSFNKNLNDYLNKWILNNACISISGSVYASEYDLSQRILRVKIGITFSNIIERVFIDIFVGN